ncbi:hypothetical protein IHE44_0012499, partial [Lamprotornis superbus]
TTGLVGLAVAENPHERLRILYTKILGVLQNIPKDAAYRKYTEQIVNERFDLVKKETDVQKLQEKLNSGQIEEVIVQAENELFLARKMMQWKPWEPLVEEPPSDQSDFIPPQTPGNSMSYGFHSDLHVFNFHSTASVLTPRTLQRDQHY